MINIGYLFETKSNNNKIILLKDFDEINQFVDKYDNVNYKKDSYDIWALMINNNFVGGAFINKKPNIENYVKFNIHPKVSVSWIIIDKEFQGMGYGNKLLDKILANYDNIALTTNYKSSKEAIHLYERKGFKVISQKGKTKYWFK